jgi:arylsulfatase A-like enzyme
MHVSIRLILGLLLVPTTITFAAEQPNILVLIADDLGVADIGVYTNGPNAEPGNPPPTPSIDALAVDGVLFRQAWSAPVCTPTRAALYTGRYGFRTGVQNVGDVLPLDETTWAELLTTEGYVSGLFGKWHLGRTTNVGGADAPRVSGGWDDFEGTLSGGLSDYFSFTETANGSSQSVSNYATTEQVDDALRWIANQTGPWTCTVAFNAPHSPFHVPPQELHTFDLSTGSTNTQRYRAAVQAMDSEIGRLLNDLGSAIDNTVVVFVGDNGTPRQVIEAPHTTSKGSVYQGGVHVPMIISAPFVSSPGREETSPVHVADLFSTILAITEIDVDAVIPDVIIDGVSLLEMLKAPGATVARETIYTEIVDADPIDGRYAIRDERYKLLELGGENELYDLSSDSLETNELIANGLSVSEQEAFDSLVSALNRLRGLESCSADLTGEGSLDFFDVSAFLTAFNQQDSVADFSNDGSFDFFDVSAFLAAFAAGCP